MLFLQIIAAFSLSVVVLAHPLYFPGFRREVGSSSGNFSGAKFPVVKAAMEGNARFVQTRNETLLRSLVADGQRPPFIMVSCSDSRVPEASIFDSQPGTFFMERNIANQYKPRDENAQSVMAYGVHVLGVQHVVVMGHYGCGGIAAAIASAPRTNINVATHIIQTWIGDIRALYLSSNRTEIVEMRTKNLQTEAIGGTVEEPDVGEPGFRALVEENIKQQVQRITQGSVITNLNEEIVLRLNRDGTLKSVPDGAAEKRVEEENKLIPVFVHGWVHDIESGEVLDLNISTGPAGFENFFPSETPEAQEPLESSTGGEGSSSVVATSTSSVEERASEESASSTAREGPTVTSAASEPSSAAARAPSTPVEVKVHGSGARSTDAPAKSKRSFRRRLN